jgi:arginyl-tRNA---protein transferase
MNNFLSPTRVHIHGQDRSPCGYCKPKGSTKKNVTSVSYGVTAKTMSVNDYERMMLIGWRRSGTYFYKPIMQMTCCPQYTIRMHVPDFKLSKSQKKVYKLLEKFLSSEPISYSHVSKESTDTLDGLTLAAEFTLNQKSTHNRASNDVDRFTIETEKSSFSPEKFDLYKRYQIEIHKDAPSSVTEVGFRRFLVDSPLVDTNKKQGTGTGLPIAYGTYHQLYRLDSKLIAVGVIDLLPSGLSSVYVFYDPLYSKSLSLGKLTALKEIEYCQKTLNLPYYYMGFYIHSCEKMKYKAEYKPCDLLCPTTLQWYPFHGHCEELLDRCAFSPLEPTLAARRAALLSPLSPLPPLSPSHPSCTSSSSQVPAAASCGSDIGTAAAVEGHTLASTDWQDMSCAAAAAAAAAAVASATTGAGDTAGKESEIGPEEGGDESDDDDGGSGGEEGSEVGGDGGALAPFAMAFAGFPVRAALDAVKKSVGDDGGSNSGSNSGGKHAVALDPSVSRVLNQVPLDIGSGHPVFLKQLRPQDIEHLTPFLLEWLCMVGPTIGATVPLAFN